MSNAAHWKTNHDQAVARCALLRQRPDLPVDRLPAYEELERLQRENDQLRRENINVKFESINIKRENLFLRDTMEVVYIAVSSGQPYALVAKAASAGKRQLELTA